MKLNKPKYILLLDTYDFLFYWENPISKVGKTGSSKSEQWKKARKLETLYIPRDRVRYSHLQAKKR